MLVAVLLVGLGALLGGWRPFSSDPDVLSFGPGADMGQFALFTGQCASGTLGSGPGFGSEADTPCGDPHDVEVVGTTPILDEGRALAYPGADAIDRLARSYCALLVDSDAVRAASGNVAKGDLTVTAVVPGEAAFVAPRTADASSSGARQVACVVSRSDGDKLTDRFSVI